MYDVFQPMRQFAQTYFDDIFVHSKAEGAKTDVETHNEYLRQVLLCIRENRLFANIDKCLFKAAELLF